MVVLPSRQLIELDKRGLSLRSLQAWFRARTTLQGKCGVGGAAEA